MTHKKWVKMSKVRRLIKVAKLAGWSVYQSDYLYGWHNIWHSEEDHWDAGLVPDYLNDLNAIQTLVNTLSDKPENGERVSNHAFYIAALVAITETFDGYAWDIVNATAAQRAEAFVLTMEPE